MNEISHLILIDSDMRRRATISHALSASQIHVEPFENVNEISGAWPRSGVILIHDEDGAVAELITQMAINAEWFPVIAFGEVMNASRIVQSVLDGAIDYVVWPFDRDDLTATLDRAHTTAGMVGNMKMREVIARNRIGKLTPREREVLNGVATGLSNRLIGEKLSISPRTVEIHRANMLNKLDANHTSEAIRIAIEAELVH